MYSLDVAEIYEYQDTLINFWNYYESKHPNADINKVMQIVILYHIYGYSLNQVGKIFKVSGERIRQILKKVSWELKWYVNE